MDGDCEVYGARSRMTKVLLPFEDRSWLDQALDSALDLAGRMSAEIVLLRVTPKTGPLTPEMPSGCLYSELKALQMQLADCRLPVTIETMPGTLSDAIANYSEWAGEDCLVVDWTTFGTCSLEDRQARAA
jgi:nucleotide-binding universal stress UspA family protein